jgi:hypothetical protein
MSPRECTAQAGETSVVAARARGELPANGAFAQDLAQRALATSRGMDRESSRPQRLRRRRRLTIGTIGRTNWLAQ